MENLDDKITYDLSIDDIEIPPDFLIEGADKVKENSQIAFWYEILAEQDYSFDPVYKKNKPNNNLDERAKRIKNCHKYWGLETYKNLNLADILNITLCKDKFCKNCQNELSKTRYRKYVPILEEYKKNYDLYHVVFTVKNVNGENLKKRLNEMYDKFPLIVQYLKGVRKAKGIDFSPYGYVGAVRSLEINVSLKNKVYDYHPHFHCIFLFKKNIDMDKLYLNDFSYSKKRNETRKFTYFEILLQKMWFLILNNKKITLKNVNALDEGYSVYAEKIDTVENSKGYKEVFKYTLKEDFKDVYSNYYVFRTLYSCLYRRKIIQGYGVLNKYIFDDEILEEVNDKLEDAYAYFKMELGKLDLPVRENVCWEQMLRNMRVNNVRFFSRGNIRKFLLQLKDDLGDLSKLHEKNNRPKISDD